MLTPCVKFLFILLYWSWAIFNGLAVYISISKWYLLFTVNSVSTRLTFKVMILVLLLLFFSFFFFDPEVTWFRELNKEIAQQNQASEWFSAVCPP